MLSNCYRVNSFIHGNKTKDEDGIHYSVASISVT